MLQLGAISETLDGLDIGVCAFDKDDRTLLWNRAFLRIFPEHAEHIHSGEPYAANLRRFYESRLQFPERLKIDRYIEEGINRHRQQTRPFMFKHRGMDIRASSLPLQGLGRVRMWRVEEQLDVGFPRANQDRGAAASVLDDSSLLEHVADGLVVTDFDQIIVWTNEAFLRLYRMNDLGRIVGKTFDEVYRAVWAATEEPDRFDLGSEVLLENLRFSGAPFELPLPDDRWARVMYQRLPDGSTLSTHVDITGMKEQQAELRRAEERATQNKALLEATLERMQQGVMMVNADRIVEVCNRRAIELLELPASLMNSRPPFEQVLEFQWAQGEFSRTNQSLQDFIRAGGITDQPQVYDRRRPNGTVLEVQSVPIAGGGVLRTYTDITQRKLDEERITHIARHDGLTSLVNREAFLEHLEEAMTRAGRESYGRLAVLYMDLDHFKPINDRYGHAIGDRVLNIAAKRMKRIARDEDIVGRMGGDEFAILQHGIDTADAALALAHRVRSGISEVIEIDTLRLNVGVSIGVAIYPGAGTDVDTLIRSADTAMYVAKAEGRDLVHLHPSPTSSPP